MKERQKIGVPVGFWNKDEPNLFLRIKEDIEREFPYYSVGAFSIQTPSSLDNDRFNLQIKYSKGIPVIHVQAPFEQENSIANYGKSLEKTLELARYFQREENCWINYHVGITLTDEEEVEGFIKSRRDIWGLCVDNFRKLADKASKEKLGVTIENEPPMFVKPLRDGTIRPVIFPFGNIVSLQKLIEDINRENVGFAFDCAHWAVSQIIPSLLSKRELVSKYFPGEDITKMLFKSHDCSSWEEYHRLQGEWGECLEEASVYHVSNTTGIGVHLSPKDEEYWGSDGTFEGYLSKQQLRDIFYQAKKNNKVIVVEVDMDLENKTFQEILSFLKSLRD